VLAYYARLIRYALAARPKIFHIQWNSNLKYLDRTLLMLYYKLLGKKIVLTAHDVNAGRRDGWDWALNRLSLRTQYQLADHIFVHTVKMKNELLEDFGVRGKAVTVIPYGINNAVPNTDLTPAQAKQRLGIRSGDRTILFFGGLRPYKGVEHLVAAFQLIAQKHQGYRLIIAGERKNGSERYLSDIQEAIEGDGSRGRVVQKVEYVPDSEAELYFKAADVLVLPYNDIFQSGVLFLGYSFGLPVIATDVGSLREDVIEEKTGFVCRPRDPVDLARTIEKYFDSSLFKNLDSRRQEVRDHANRTHSWDAIAEMTREVYLRLLQGSGSSLPNDQ
jgi:glycosyltransferase involved in cell wall biosynthesis